MDPDTDAAASSNSVEAIYSNIKWRLGGIIKALSSDEEEFYNQCDPDKENMCLYGLSDGTWRVGVPTEEVPPELPEPAVGINFARDGMVRDDWLALVALHSDAWLLATASFYGAELTRSERKRLLMMISDLPTAFEVVTDRDAGEIVSNLDQFHREDNQHQDNETSGSSRFIHMAVSHSEATVPENSIPVPKTASTAKGGNEEPSEDTSPNQTMPHPATLVKKKRPASEPCQGKQRKQKVSVPSEPSGLNLTSRIEMSAPHKQNSGRGRLPKKNHYGDTGLIGQSTRARPLEVYVRRQGVQIKKQAQAKPTQGKVRDMDEIVEHSLADVDQCMFPEENDDDILCDICKVHDSGDDKTIFWIACDCCQKWFHGNCVKITVARAEYMKHFKCPTCTSKRAILQFL